MSEAPSPSQSTVGRLPLRYGAVLIGRNEGERLAKCLSSVGGATSIVYVDSGSKDGSPELAHARRVELVEIEALTFTAARARNAGFRRLRERSPDLQYVQFVDGDCELDAAWPLQALVYLADHADTAVVAGRRREAHPERSVYNWLCEREWDGPTGEVRSVGGDAMVRVTAFEAVDGFRDDLIAGEEPELCFRLRGAGWRIVRLAAPMTHHDAAMTHFAQWWRRTLRSGYAFAQGAVLHGHDPERHWVWESRRALLWGIALPILCAIASVVYFPAGLATWLIYPLQVLRQTARNRGVLADRLTLAAFQVLSRFPEAVGQLHFWRDQLLKRRAQLIEYK